MSSDLKKNINFDHARPETQTHKSTTISCKQAAELKRFDQF